ERQPPDPVDDRRARFGVEETTAEPSRIDAWVGDHVALRRPRDRDDRHRARHEREQALQRRLRDELCGDASEHAAGGRRDLEQHAEAEVHQVHARSAGGDAARRGDDGGEADRRRHRDRKSKAEIEERDEKDAAAEPEQRARAPGDGAGGEDDQRKGWSNGRHRKVRSQKYEVRSTKVRSTKYRSTSVLQTSNLELARLCKVTRRLLDGDPLCFFARRTVGARKAGAGVDVRDCAVVDVAELVGLDRHLPSAEFLLPPRIVFWLHEITSNAERPEDAEKKTSLRDPCGACGACGACVGSSSFLNRRTDKVSPFRPRSIVVLHLLEPEQVLQREPREARSFADAAVRNHRLIARNALRRVQRAQLVEALERPVVVAVLAPRDALRAWNVSAALTGLRQTGRRENLSRELLRAAHVDERRRLLLHGLLHFRQERAERRVGTLRLVGLGGERRLVGAEI